MKNACVVMAQYVATFFSAILNIIFLSPRVMGEENLEELIELKKKSGLGIVFISNHINAGDPFVETAMFPLAVKKVVFPINFLAAHEKFSNPLKSFFMKLLGCIPVGDGKGENIRQIIKMIKAGQTVYLFPEGRVSLDGKMGKDIGALKAFGKFSEMIVQPICIEGLKPFWDFIGMLAFQRRASITFGKPFILQKKCDIDAMEIIAGLRTQKEDEPALAQKPQFEAGE